MLWLCGQCYGRWATQPTEMFNEFHQIKSERGKTSKRKTKVEVPFCGLSQLTLWIWTVIKMVAYQNQLIEAVWWIKLQLEESSVSQLWCRMWCDFVSFHLSHFSLGLSFETPIHPLKFKSVDYCIFVEFIFFFLRIRWIIFAIVSTAMNSNISFKRKILRSS